MPCSEYAKAIADDKMLSLKKKKDLMDYFVNQKGFGQG